MKLLPSIMVSYALLLTGCSLGAPAEEEISAQDQIDAIIESVDIHTGLIATDPPTTGDELLEQLKEACSASDIPVKYVDECLLLKYDKCAETPQVIMDYDTTTQQVIFGMTAADDMTEKTIPYDELDDCINFLLLQAMDDLDMLSHLASSTAY